MKSAQIFDMGGSTREVQFTVSEISYENQFAIHWDGSSVLQHLYAPDGTDLLQLEKKQVYNYFTWGFVYLSFNPTALAYQYNIPSPQGSWKFGMLTMDPSVPSLYALDDFRVSISRREYGYLSKNLAVGESYIVNLPSAPGWYTGEVYPYLSASANTSQIKVSDSLLYYTYTSGDYAYSYWLPYNQTIVIENIWSTAISLQIWFNTRVFRYLDQETSGGSLNFNVNSTVFDSATYYSYIALDINSPTSLKPSSLYIPNGTRADPLYRIVKDSQDYSYYTPVVVYGNFRVSLIPYYAWFVLEDDIYGTWQLMLELSDFEVSASPTSRSIDPGQSTTYTVTVTSNYGFNSPVSLSLSGLPTGASYTFDPASVTPPSDGSAQSTLQISTKPATPTGIYSLTITGSSGTRTRSTAVTLTIAGADTAPPNIVHTPVTTGNEGQQITITATITDNFAVTEATLYYRKKTETAYTRVSMTKLGNTYGGTIPASAVTTIGVDYYLNASDGTNFSTHPATNPTASPHTITVTNLQPSAVALNAPSDIAEDSMKLTWTQNANNDFKKYEIYQSTSSDQLGTNIQTITEKTTTEFTVTALSPSTTYYFKIRVVDTGGLHADSNQVSAKTLAESTPPTVTVTIEPLNPDTTQTVIFTITAEDTGGSGIANIMLYIDGTQVDTWTTSGTHTYTGGPYSEGTHTYYATACDSAGNDCREPSTGSRNFTVKAQLPLPLWQIAAVIGVIAAVLIIIGVAIFVLRKRK